MQQAAEMLAPKVVKISSKRQITIPAEYYKERSFSDYALVTWTENGFEVQPVDMRDDDLDVKILTSLVQQGYAGQELVAAFEGAKKKVVNIDTLIKQAEDDVAAGRVRDDFDVMVDEVAAKHGL